MNISSLGEFAFIERFSKKWTSHSTPGVTRIGDDCAVIPYNQTESFLITMDTLVENVHFIKDSTPPEDLGYKTLTVNVSDIAAMGGTPKYAFLSLAVPEQTTIEWLDLFLKGFMRLAQTLGVSLLGGDTTRSLNGITITVTLTGLATTSQLKFRSNAKQGDIICVTGNLGDSAAGLKTIFEKTPIGADVEFLIQQHFRPPVLVQEARWLAGQQGVHAMIDISDGIDSDIKHILKKSNCGASIMLDQLPISNALKNISRAYGWSIHDLAACGGEDYQLLLTVASTDFLSITTAYQKLFGVALHAVGEITTSKLLTYMDHGQVTQLDGKGFDHFAVSAKNEGEKC